jgi:hypothetical protein
MQQPREADSPCNQESVSPYVYERETHTYRDPNARRDVDRVHVRCCDRLVASRQISFFLLAAIQEVAPEQRHTSLCMPTSKNQHETGKPALALGAEGCWPLFLCSPKCPCDCPCSRSPMFISIDFRNAQS